MHVSTNSDTKVPCICWCDAVRSRTVLNITSFAAILYSISPAACYGVLVYSIVGTIVATKGFGPWLGFYQLQRVKQEAGLRGGLSMTDSEGVSTSPHCV